MKRSNIFDEHLMKKNYRRVQDDFQGLAVHEKESDSGECIESISFHDIGNLKNTLGHENERKCHAMEDSEVCGADFDGCIGKSTNKSEFCLSNEEWCSNTNSILSANEEFYQLLDMSMALDASGGEIIFLVSGIPSMQNVHQLVHRILVSSKSDSFFHPTRHRNPSFYMFSSNKTHIQISNKIYNSLFSEIETLYAAD